MITVCQRMQPTIRSEEGQQVQQQGGAAAAAAAAAAVVSLSSSPTTTYQIVLACFIPGRPYHEDAPGSAEACRRRVPPAGYDSTTCITDRTRVWALYERCMVYPMYLVTYTVARA